VRRRLYVMHVQRCSSLLIFRRTAAAKQRVLPDAKA
jgi:hypothetical protein